ncbi:MAG: amino acid racemase [bacterium]
MKKTIGIIGGMTPKSTALIYNNIIDSYQKKYNDYGFPEILIYSVSFQNYISWMQNGNWDAIADALIKVVHSLHNAGADFCIISTNTMHKIYDRIEKKSPIPMLNIIDAVADEITSFGIKKVTLLGTRYTMSDTFYKEGLKKYGIDTIVPDKQDIDVINNIIFEELGKEIINNDSKKKIINIIKYLNLKGSEGVILGCTELPLIINEENSPTKIFDSVKILSSKALMYSLK